jgi:hypothetical protein
VAEKKFPVGPLLSATLGKGFAEGLVAFAESFRLSAKPGFPVVTPVLFRSSLSLIFSLSSIFLRNHKYPLLEQNIYNARNES